MIGIRWRWSTGDTVYTDDYPSAAAARRWIASMIRRADRAGEATVIIVQKIGF